MARKNKNVAQGPRTFDIGNKLNNIKMLVATKRPKEAIAYQFMLFTMICQARYNEMKHPAQSIRDYAMAMVNRHGLNPSNLYPFVEQVESVIYGGRQPSEQKYRETVEAFGKVFQEIVGKPLPQF